MSRAEGDKGMTCLHPYPENLRIPDWDNFEDIRIILCRDCVTVLEINYGSQSGELIYKVVEASLETLYNLEAQILF